MAQIKPVFVYDIKRKFPEFTGAETLELALRANQKLLDNAQPGDDTSKVSLHMKIQEATWNAYQNILKGLHTTSENSTSPTV